MSARQNAWSSSWFRKLMCVSTAIDCIFYQWVFLRLENAFSGVKVFRMCRVLFPPEPAPIMHQSRRGRKQLRGTFWLCHMVFQCSCRLCRANWSVACVQWQICKGRAVWLWQCQFQTAHKSRSIPTGPVPQVVISVYFGIIMSWNLVLLSALELCVQIWNF